MFAKKLLVGALAAAAFISAQAADQKVLRMATESSYPPFEFVETKTGETVGFEIDLLRGIAERIGRKLEIVPMGFDAIIPALLTNTADVGMAAITITPERQKRLAFTASSYVSGLSVLIRAADKATITKVEDLNNRTICAQIGTSGHMRAQQVPGAKVKAFNNVSETFLELSNKGCDAVIGDRPVNSYFLMSRPPTEGAWSLSPRPSSLRRRTCPLSREITPSAPASRPCPWRGPYRWRRGCPSDLR